MRTGKRKGPAATWRVIDRGRVPDPPPNVAQFTCTSCWAEAALPVLGLPIAQIGSGLVFDLGDHAMPRVIECRRCRHRYETEG
jgi:hypothetical protein